MLLHSVTVKICLPFRSIWSFVSVGIDSRRLLLRSGWSFAVCCESMSLSIFNVTLQKENGNNCLRPYKDVYIVIRIFFL